MLTKKQNEKRIKSLRFIRKIIKSYHKKYCLKYEISYDKFLNSLFFRLKYE